MAGRLPQAWLDELRDRADIVQVVSRYVQLNPKGGRYWGLCPFHGEKTPSFSVNPQRQMYYCFGCHAGGSAITFVMEMEHLDFMDAVKLLAEQVHMEVPELTHSREDSESKSRKERLYEANKQCARFFHAQLWKEESAEILAYLHGRELSDSTIRIFGLGATPPHSDGATRAMRELGFTDDELVSAGISVRREGRVYDMFRQRAIFPIIDAQGRVLGFGGRALGDVKPKYLNTGDTPIFNKRLGVFAANLLKKQRGLKRVILTEGYMDVIALVQAGVPGVCARRSRSNRRGCSSAMRRKSGFPTTAMRQDNTRFCARWISSKKRASLRGYWIFRAGWIPTSTLRHMGRRASSSSSR